MGLAVVAGTVVLGMINWMKIVAGVFMSPKTSLEVIEDANDQMARYFEKIAE